MNSEKIIGIDIGGTKIHVGVVKDGEIIEEAKFPTSAQAPQEQVIQEIIDAITPFIDTDVVGIGIGVPGLIDPEKGIVYDVVNIPSWKKVPLKDSLESHFQIPVVVTNDANTFALGEKIYGKARKYKNLVGITLGTGLGAGIIINNSLHAGAYSCAGELGGMSYLDETVEDYCSGKFFKKFGMEGKELLELAEAGDEKALEIFRQFGYHLGKTIKQLMFTLSPEAIFLGGSVSNCYPFFKDAMQEQVDTFPYKLVKQQLVIETSSLPNAAIYGAAALIQMKAGFH